MSKSYWLSGLQRRTSRRSLLRASAAGALGLATLAALGCSGDEDGGASGGEGSGDDAGTPKPGGTLRMGTLTDMNSLDPHLIVASQIDTLYPIFDSLTKYDHQLKVTPQLVKSWEQTEGGSKVVLTLREGVKYHSGKDFTSEDVAWNLQRVKDPKLPYAQFRSSANWFPTIETPDKFTVILKSDKPRPATFDFFELLRIADPTSLQASDAATKAVGTGPWTFVEWRQGQHLKLAKNPTYWDSGKPYLDGVTWSVALQPETMVSQLEAGALDGVFQPPINGFVRFRGDSNFQAIVHPSTGAYYLMGFNTTIAPFNDKRVRQAFNWAIDRQRFATLIAKDIVQPASLPWPKTSLAYDEAKNKHYSFDPKKATDLLRAANATDIKTTIITYPARSEVVEFVPIWQADLKTIGVDMQIQHMETAAWVDAANNLKYNAVHAAGSSYAGLGSPSSLFTTTTNVWSAAGKNNTGFTNARWEELTAQASTEIDQQKAKAIYSELNDLLLDESHLCIYGPQPPRLAVNKKVKGAAHHMHDGFEYINAWLA